MFLGEIQKTVEATNLNLLNMPKVFFGDFQNRGWELSRIEPIPFYCTNYRKDQLLYKRLPRSR